MAMELEKLVKRINSAADFAERGGGPLYGVAPPLVREFAQALAALALSTREPLSEEQVRKIWRAAIEHAIHRTTKGRVMANFHHVPSVVRALEWLWADLQDSIDKPADALLAAIAEKVPPPCICEGGVNADRKDCPIHAATQPNFQDRIQKWMTACFGHEIMSDRVERNHRFLEEALELVQSCGTTQSEAQQLVDYVYSRPVGELAQEVGGVMVTLAGLCLAQGLDMNACGETELERVWTKIEKIRAKQAAKPKHSPLPEAEGNRRVLARAKMDEQIEDERNRHIKAVCYLCREGDEPERVQRGIYLHSSNSAPCVATPIRALYDSVDGELQAEAVSTR
jgi:hypothetical protein